MRPDKFDMINSRFLADGINSNRWESLVLEYKLLLRPGGWLQMAEIQWEFHSHSDHDLTNLTVWSGTYREALLGMQKDPDVIRRLERFARQAGFERVHGITRNIQVGNWRPGSCFVRVDCDRPSAN